MRLKIIIILFLFFTVSENIGQNDVDSLYKLAEEAEDDSIKISLLLEIADHTLKSNNISGYRNSIKYIEAIIDYSSKSDPYLQYHQLIGYYKKNAFYDSLVHTYRKMANHSLREGDTLAYIDASNWEAYYYTYIGELHKSLNLLNENLRLSEALNDSNLLHQTYVMMGFVIRETDMLKARECFKKGLLYCRDTLDFLYSASLNEIGNTYTSLNEPEKAIAYIERALKIREAQNENTRLYSYNDIAYAYSKMGKYEEAIYYMKKCIRLEEELDDKRSMALTCSSLGFYLFKSGENEKALFYLNKSLELAKEINLAPIFIDVYNNLYIYYKDQEDYKNALYFYEQQIFYKDSLQLFNLKEQLAEIEKKYKNEKQEAELKLIKKVKKEKERVIRNQRVAGGVIIFLSFCISIFALIAYRSKQKEKKVNLILKMQNEEILRQKEKIEETSEHLLSANKKISEKNKFITDNIKYARRIQKAMLTSEEELNSIIPENFVIYKPKNIVSGDFYIVRKHADSIIFILADCTGHGVSGAFMSILGMSLINEIILEQNYTSTGDFLDLLRKKVKQSLHQHDPISDTIDGMDLAICIYHTTSKELMYSGAQISLYLINDKTVTELKADYMPVGMGLSGDKPFKVQRKKLTGKEMIYLFSDGYPDQFGGKEGKKFMISRVIEMLTEICDKPMQTQKSYVEAVFKNWQGQQAQLDDVVFVGFKL